MKSSSRLAPKQTPPSEGPQAPRPMGRKPIQRSVRRRRWEFPFERLYICRIAKRLGGAKRSRQLCVRGRAVPTPGGKDDTPGDSVSDRKADTSFNSRDLQRGHKKAIFNGQPLLRLNGQFFSDKIMKCLPLIQNRYPKETTRNPLPASRFTWYPPL